LEELHSSMSQLQASCNDLDMKCSRLHDEKNSVLKALDTQKAEAVKLRSKIEELEKCSGKKDDDIGKLNAALEEKKGKINNLSKDIELLQLTVAEAEKRRKGGIWTWLYAATTTVVAAISFIYASRSH
jgi:predicted nuclease with TOPRIM domain